MNRAGVGHCPQFRTKARGSRAIVDPNGAAWARGSPAASVEATCEPRMDVTGTSAARRAREALWAIAHLLGDSRECSSVRGAPPFHPSEEAHFTEDLKRIAAPTLILQGDDNRIVPIGASALLSAEHVKNAQSKVYKGGSHGICSTHKAQVNQDLLDFTS